LRNNKHDIAIAISKGICDYFGITFATPPDKNSKLYKVQVGAFSNRNNAENLKNELMQKGYSAIIVE
jgi:N-acetylmuramoyl-L-alanine amidase